MEFHYIKQYHSREFEWGYNLIDGGGSGMWGLKHTDEWNTQRSEHAKEWHKHNENPTKDPNVRKKISESRMGKFKGEDNPFYGKEHTPEMIEFFISSQTGSKSKTSKTYIVTFPDGHEEMITGMKEFCRQNNLNPSGMFAVAKGRQLTTKGGWKCRHYDLPS
jgi:hypothetical protein